MPEDDFCSKFILKFENKIETTRLDESAMYKLFYGNEHVVEVASQFVRIHTNSLISIEKILNRTITKFYNASDVNVRLTKCIFHHQQLQKL